MKIRSELLTALLLSGQGWFYGILGYITADNFAFALSSLCSIMGCVNWYQQIKKSKNKTQ
jgi:hypothetical protein